MRSSHIGRVSLFTLLVSLAMICGAVVGYAQAPKVPPSGPRTPAPAAPAKPAPRKPADPAPAAAPKPAPAADVRFKSKYTTGDQVTDACHVDAPKSAAAADNTDGASSSTSCHDEVKTTQNGDAKVLGFPISYITAFLDADGKPMVVAMEVTEFEITSLDAALFEIPQGFAAVMNAQELSKAVSNANETKLASGELAAAAPQKKLGSIRVGVPEVANKTTQALDTRALRTKLIADLAEAKVDAVPLAAAPQPQLEARAAELGIDYLLMAEVTEL